MKGKTKTIGQKADKIAKEYISLYETFKKDDIKGIRDKAEGLAKYDLIALKIIYEFALKTLEEHIAKDKEAEK